MQAKHINPFFHAVIDTFDMMVGCKLRRGPLELNGGRHPDHVICGIVGLSGKAIGSIVLSFSETAILQSVSAMTGDRQEEINRDVMDTVGELTNIVAGSAKRELEEFTLSISLPNVVVGEDFRVRFPSQIVPITVPFDSEWGALALEVGLTPVTERVCQFS